MGGDAEEERPGPSLVKPLVFGGIDGLTTTLALVWSSTGAGEQLVSAGAVLVLGVANLVATAVSMGIGDYVGTLAEYEANEMQMLGSSMSGSLTARAIASHARAVKVAALRSGLTMFTSFIVFGGLPLLVYLPVLQFDIEQRRFVSTFLCFVSFLLLGYARAKLTKGAVLVTAVSMAALGSAAALVSYLASKVIYALVVGVEPPATG
jgi:predicted membrane protein (TIGR00267 family)